MERTAIISIAVQLILIIPGLFLYVIVFIGLFVIFKTTKNTFYLLMLSLAVADIIYLCETLFYSIPCIFTQIRVYGGVMERITGHIDTTTWFLQCSHVLFISINRLRFVASRSLQTYDDVFSFRKTLIWIAVLWIFSIGMTAMSEAVSCYKYFNAEDFYWTFNCTTSEPSTNPGMILNSVVSGIFCILSALLYAVTWIILKKRSNWVPPTDRRDSHIHKSHKHRLSNEISLLIQASAVSTCLLLNYLGFWVIGKYNATILIQFFAIANATVDAYIYFLFNKPLRKWILKLFHCRTSTCNVDQHEMVVESSEGRKSTIICNERAVNKSDDQSNH